MTIHREGYKTIFITFLLVAVIFLTFNHIFPRQTWFHAALYALGLWFFLQIVKFFRSPVRELKGGENKVMSPADGKVVVIEKTFEPEYFKDERIQISIFMSARNVHINWFPVSGMIKYYYYHQGLHMVAFNPKSSLENERSTTVIETEGGTQILIRQIAGAVARRIKTYPKVGTPEIQGDELGFIKFGSRVDLLLPLDANVEVVLGQLVVGKQTVIAQLS
ncbi:MAG TPA: phosphatidylserine decarboxylase family protein [Bacteroidales bacterium]|nr:phosphatidylserine decarboxylase family protein [Bacteroidales bacterium]